MEFLRRLFATDISQKQPTPQQPEGTSKLAATQSLSSNSRLIILLGIVMIAGLWLFVGLQINADYDRTIAETSTETQNLAKAFEEHVRRIVAGADKDLLNLKSAYERDGLASPVFTTYMETAAKDQSRNLIAIYNEQGVIVTSFIQNAVGINHSDMDYFLEHQDAASQRLVIGRPITCGISGQLTIPLTRRINKPDGSFGGIVFIGIKESYFPSFYTQINLGQDQRISLTGADGFTRARQSGTSTEIGQDMRNTEFWHHISSGRPCETYISTHSLDNINRLMTYRVMPDYPLIVLVAKSTQVALAGWEQRKQGYLLGASLVSFFLLAFCGLLVNRHEKLLVRDAELSAANRKLRETNAAVQQERDWLSVLFNSVRDEIWYTDTKKNITLINSQLFREAGFVPAETAVEDVAAGLEILRPDGSPRPLDEAPLLRGLRGESVASEEEIIRSPASGQWRHREFSVNPVRDAAGNITGAIAVARDITERKRLEAELKKHHDDLQHLVVERTRELVYTLNKLRHSEKKLITILNNSPVMIVILRMADNKYLEVNQKFLDTLGFTREEVLGRTPLELGLRVDNNKTDALIKRVREKEGYHNVEITLRAKSGKIITILKSSVSINLGDEPCRISSMIDISKEKVLDAELARLDRLNTIGEMAASIGHEVRNPLTTVRGYLQVFQRKEKNAEYHGQIKTMIEELDRANFIISEFLSLAKNKAICLKRSSLNDIVSILLPLLQADAFHTGRDLQVEMGDIPDLSLDDKEIRQLLLNLVRNGMDATPPGGRVTITTSLVDEKVILAVADTGHGIPKEIFDKLGTPFVTTKDNGTGLGLPVCYRIADRHQAKIEVKTGPGGSTFIVAFPRPA